MISFDGLPGDLVEEMADAGLDPLDVYAHVVAALGEDLPGAQGDLTSEATIPEDARGVADFAARDAGVVAGLSVAAMVLHTVMGDEVVVEDRVLEGSHVRGGEVVMRASGPIRGLLTAERTALNLVCHLSGVATATDAWVTALEGTKARVLDTRKTLPGLRALQKYAVRCGGGVNHRFSLSDLALVKDNHVIAAGGVLPAYEAVRAAHPDLPVEVEVTDLDQLRQLLDAGCDRILLDNMDTETMAEAVRITDGRATLEASGGLTIERARDVARTGVDFISVGALTHSVRVFDIGMDLSPHHATRSARAAAGTPKSPGDESLLAADIGNSHTVLGLVDDGKVIRDWRVATSEHRTADEWAVLLRGLLGDDVEHVTGIAVCATVPAVLQEWRLMLADHFADVRSVVVEPGVRTGVPVLMDNPREVGSDRIINALAAATEYGGPAIVVDFGGTATTFDVVSAKGQYIGGSIAPGIEISLDALGERGAQLRKVELVRPRSVIAKNTVEALQSGMLFGVASLVEGIVGRMIVELGADPADVRVVATGYLAPLVVDECRCFTDHAPWLTLRGLELVFARNT